jgi:nicotinate-nucleotide adenylyltransferase
LKIALYGGTFDPIHTAHLIIAQYTKEEFSLDKIIFVPSGIPPHKQVHLPPNLRLELVKLAIGGNAAFECSEMEIRLTNIGYSLDTVQAFKTELNLAREELFFIIGSDSFLDFPRWKRPDEILKLCTVVVYPRNYRDFEAAAPEFSREVIYLQRAPILELSSKLIRSWIKQNRSITYLVPEAVERVILAQKLYQ